jgi:hypothetical protein
VTGLSTFPALGPRRCCCMHQPRTTLRLLLPSRSVLRVRELGMHLGTPTEGWAFTAFARESEYAPLSGICSGFVVAGQSYRRARRTLIMSICKQHVRLVYCLVHFGSLLLAQLSLRVVLETWSSIHSCMGITEIQMGNGPGWSSTAVPVWLWHVASGKVSTDLKHRIRYLDLTLSVDCLHVPLPPSPNIASNT